MSETFRVAHRIETATFEENPRLHRPNVGDYFWVRPKPGDMWEPAIVYRNDELPNHDRLISVQLRGGKLVDFMDLAEFGPWAPPPKT